MFVRHVTHHVSVRHVTHGDVATCPWVTCLTETWRSGVVSMRMDCGWAIAAVGKLLWRIASSSR